MTTEGINYCTAGDAGVVYPILEKQPFVLATSVQWPGSENRFRQNNHGDMKPPVWPAPAYHGRRRGGTFESQPRWGTLVDCFPDTTIVRLLVNTINKQANTTSIHSDLWHFCQTRPWVAEAVTEQSIYLYTEHRKIYWFSLYSKSIFENRSHIHIYLERRKEGRTTGHCQIASQFWDVK